mgnify:CR=1 FL=1
MKSKKNSFDSYSKKPLKDEVRKAMNRYFNQLDQQNTPINVIIKTRNECFKWIKDISNVIRTNIITACTINKLCMN